MPQMANLSWMNHFISIITMIILMMTFFMMTKTPLIFLHKSLNKNTNKLWKW